MNEIAAKAGVQIGELFSQLRTVWGFIGLVLVTIALADLPGLEGHIQFATTALLSTAPYIFVAIMMIAALKATGAEHVLAKAFEGRELQMITLAAFFGGLAPFCSCEVIPFIAGLLVAGVPLSAIMAFWLSSPLIDPPTLLITAKALGWSFAVSKLVFAVLIGLFGGLAVLCMNRFGLLHSPAKPGSAATGCGCGPALGSEKPLWKFWQESERLVIFRETLLTNAVFLLKWLCLAYLLESLLITYIPAEWIGKFVGGEGLGPVVLSALVGAPAYLNSYAAPPLVAGLMDQGMSNGAAMAFMIAGSVSCIPAMVAVYSLVRPQVFASYVVLGFIGAIGSGMIFMAIF